MTQKKQDETANDFDEPEKALTYAIIGGFYEVFNTMGYGFAESVYARCLVLELTGRGLKVEREVLLDVFYRSVCVGAFRADLLIESKVVVELKATLAIGEPDRMQLLNYLRCSELEVGLLLHFGLRPRIVRMVSANYR